MIVSAKSMAAKYGLVASILAIILSTLSPCDCAVWFVSIGVAAAFPAIWGRSLVRLVGICLCIASLVGVVAQLREQSARQARVLDLRENMQDSQSQQ